MADIMLDSGNSVNSVWHRVWEWLIDVLYWLIWVEDEFFETCRAGRVILHWRAPMFRFEGWLVFWFMAVFMAAFQELARLPTMGMVRFLSAASRLDLVDEAQLAWAAVVLEVTIPMECLVMVNKGGLYPLT